MRLSSLSMLAALALALAAGAPPLHAATSGLTDTLDVAVAGAEAGHRFASRGRVTREVAGGWVGGHDTRRPSRTVAGKGSWAEYRLRVAPRQPVTVEIEETHGRETGVIGYSVLADGKPVAFRSWKESGAGPVHWFVELPATEKDAVTIRLVNEGPAPFHISRMWAFSDFDGYFQRSGLDVPYYIAPLVGLRWDDRDVDLKTLSKITNSMPAGGPARPAFTVALPYANLDDGEIRRRVRYVLDLARRSGMPVQIALDTWWASTPDGSDGKGGFWRDVKYQQVVYNATKKRYQLSIPNQWSSTPWLTVDDPTLNAFKAARLTVAANAVRDAAADLRADGRPDLLLAVNLDNEPVYWASGNAGLGGDVLEADFNRAAVARAKRAGVRLDPTDGLDRSERLWLFRNLLGYNAMMAGTAAKALGRGITIVQNGRAMPDSEPPVANIYTQAMVADPSLQYPMLSTAWPLWETAAPESAQVGGEWNGDSPTERQAITHQIALGRNAGTNAEAGNDAANLQSVLPGYALGQRFLALYNYPLDRMDAATAGLRDLSKPWLPPTFLPVLHEETFRDNGWKSSVAGHRGIQTGLIGNTAAIAAFPASAEAPGVISWRLAAPRGGWMGIFLELNGRARDFEAADLRVRIRVLAGAAPDDLRVVRTYHDAGSITEADRVDLSALAKGGAPVFVRLEMDAPGLRPDTLSWCAVWGVRFVTPWPVPAGSAQRVSVREARRHSLVVSWRADAERALSRLGEVWPGPGALPNVRQAYARGAYADAFHQAEAALATSWPATYRVENRGPLSPYPISLDAASPVTATVEENGPLRTSIRLRSDEGTAVRLTLGRLSAGARYDIAFDGERWTASKDTAGDAIANTKGEITWSGTLPGRNATPDEVHGTFLGMDGDGALMVAPTRGGRLSLRLAPSAAILRIPTDDSPVSQTPALLRGDAVTVRVLHNGTASGVTAVYRTVAGTVAAVKPMSPWEMPSVTLLDGEKHIIDLYAPVHLPERDATLRALPVGAEALHPGEAVRLRLQPDTGRVFELWKQPNAVPSDQTGGKGAGS
jgi:hypothetical protein